MAQRQLYITGGIGSQSSGEAFSSDYDLPNDTVYDQWGTWHRARKNQSNVRPVQQR